MMFFGSHLWRAMAFAHRWLGIAGCLVFVVWFASGIAMIYVRMPALSSAERLAHAAPLEIDAITTAPADAVLAAGVSADAPVELRMLGGRPVYRVGGRVQKVVFADTGELLALLSSVQAAGTVSSFIEAGAPPRPLGVLTEPDQWTLQLRQHCPLFHFALADGQGTELYVSSATGEVVLDTTRRERMLAYLGPVAHWLYFPVLRRNGPLWTQVIIWTSAIGCLLCLSGLLAGGLRYSPTRRFRVYGQHVSSPYTGWLKWHHYAGLMFGLITLSWTFSGLLSMGPFEPLSNRGIHERVSTAIAGTPQFEDALSLHDVRDAARAFNSTFLLKEMRLFSFRGARYWIGTSESETTLIASAERPSSTFAAFSEAAMEEAAQSIAADPLLDLTWLNEYDEHYYDREGKRPLPVLRARYGDPESTWTYLDPSQGAAVLTVGERDRLNRWLYHGLHSLDPKWLRERRPMWDGLVILLSLGGIAGVATSLLPAWRRLRRLAGRRVSSGLRPQHSFQDRLVRRHRL